MKHEMPFVPGGASGTRARTRWMMLPARSCSPKVMKIFWPVMRQVPSPADRLGAHRPEVGTGLRLGQVHGAGPLAGHHLFQEGGLLPGAAVLGQHVDGALSQHRARGEPQAGRG